MSSIYRCTASDCEKRVVFESRGVALAAGWVLVEIETGARRKYHVLCPDHIPKWVTIALDDGKAPTKGKVKEDR